MATRRAQPDIVPDEPTTKAPKAKATKAPATNGNGDGEKKSRRVMGDRNWLAREIDGVIRNSDGPITVSEIVAKITNKHGENPSSGAVAAALKRWSEQGYINVIPKPLSFKSFQAKYKNSTLDSFLDKSREERLAARRAAKAA
jgi:hypothetical protein